MLQLQAILPRFFPSNPKTGCIGSMEFNIWMAQIVGVPLIGLKEESFGLQAAILVYGVTMLTIVTFFYTGFELYDMALCYNDLNSLTQNCAITLTHVGAVFKVINILYRLPDLTKVLHKLKFVTKKYVVCDSQVETFLRGEVQNKVLLAGYIFIVVFTGALCTSMLLYYPTEVYGERFPYRAKLPEWLSLDCRLIYMSVSVMIHGAQIIAVDFLNVTLINQIRYQLRVLNLAFNELSEQEDAQDMVHLEPVKKLQSIIQHHCLLLELRAEVEVIFRIPVLVQFLASVALFTMTGFQAIVRTGGTNSTVVIYLYCGCILCQVLLYCWCGNYVFEQSKTLSITGYSSSWYQFDQSFRKSLLIFLTNAQRPFLFTAGGFVDLSLPSFAGILSRSYTFVAVLRQVYGK